MRFSSDISAAPRNVALLLDHSEYGVGIGVIQRHEYDGRPPYDSVQFGHVSDRGFGTVPPGVSMPSPVKLEELSGWCALDSITSEVAWVTEADKRVLKLEKAMMEARDTLAVLGIYADSETIIDAAVTVADNLNKALEIA